MVTIKNIGIGFVLFVTGLCQLPVQGETSANRITHPDCKAVIAGVRTVQPIYRLLLDGQFPPKGDRVSSLAFELGDPSRHSKWPTPARIRHLNLASSALSKGAISIAVDLGQGEASVIWGQVNSSGAYVLADSSVGLLTYPHDHGATLAAGGTYLAHGFLGLSRFSTLPDPTPPNSWEAPISLGRWINRTAAFQQVGKKLFFATAFKEPEQIPESKEGRGVQVFELPGLNQKPDFSNLGAPVLTLAVGQKSTAGSFPRVTSVGMSKSGLIAYSVEGGRIFLYQMSKQGNRWTANLLDSKKVLGWTYDISFTSDSKYLLVKGNGEANVYQIESGKLKKHADLKDQGFVNEDVSALTAANQHSWIVGRARNGSEILVYDLEAGEVRTRIPVEEGAHALAVAADDSFLAWAEPAKEGDKIKLMALGESH